MTLPSQNPRHFKYASNEGTKFLIWFAVYIITITVIVLWPELSRYVECC